MEKAQDDRRVRKTKAALRKGFAELLGKKAAKDISVRELCDLVDLHRGTFYLHYRDIFDLQEQIENEMMNEFQRLLAQYVPTKIFEGPEMRLRVILKYIADNAEMCRALLGGNGDIAFFNKLLDLAREQCLSDWNTLSPSHDQTSYEYFSHYVISGCVGVIRHWLETDMELPLEQVAYLVQEMAVRGLVAEVKF